MILSNIDNFWEVRYQSLTSELGNEFVTIAEDVETTQIVISRFSYLDKLVRLTKQGQNI